MRKLTVDEIVVPLLLAVFELLVFGFALLGGAFVFAVVGSLVDGLLNFYGAYKSPYCQWAGWLLGLVLGGAGYWQYGYRRWKTYFEHWHPGYVEEDVTPEEEIVVADPNRKTILINDLRTRRETAVAIAISCLLGVLAGGIAASYAALVWFAVSYSPITPNGWEDSIEATPQGSPADADFKPAATDGWGVTTSHPTAQRWVVYWFAIVTPLVSLAGTLLCLYFYFRNTRGSRLSVRSE